MWWPDKDSDPQLHVCRLVTRDQTHRCIVLLSLPGAGLEGMMAHDKYYGIYADRQ